MPFASEAQRKFLWAKHPKVARKWAHEYPKGKLSSKLGAVKRKLSKFKKPIGYR